jgi:hypothetical protein
MALIFRCTGCANTEIVGHLIRGRKCDVGETISTGPCSSFRPDIAANCQHCFYNSSKNRLSDFVCSATGEYISSCVHYCRNYAENDELGRAQEKKGCFVTTAVCNILGYPDNCDMLNILRTFRDEKLLSSNYSFLVDDYYERSTSIVNYINSCPDKFNLASYVYDVLLNSITNKIKDGLFEEVILDYSSMVEYLEFLIENEEKNKN